MNPMLYFIGANLVLLVLCAAGLFLIHLLEDDIATVLNPGRRFLRWETKVLTCGYASSCPCGWADWHAKSYCPNFHQSNTLLWKKDHWQEPILTLDPGSSYQWLVTDHPRSMVTGKDLEERK